jgi:hypothetical protein
MLITVRRGSGRFFSSATGQVTSVTGQGFAEPAADAMAGSAADGIQGRWIRVA